MKNVVKFKDCADNITLVNVSNQLVNTLYQVKDVVLSETKYFEKRENAHNYFYQEGLFNPNNNRPYRRLLALSTGLKKSNKETKIKSFENNI